MISQAAGVDWRRSLVDDLVHAFRPAGSDSARVALCGAIVAVVYVADDDESPPCVRCQLAHGAELADVHGADVHRSGPVG